MTSPKIAYIEATLKRLTGCGQEREKENNNKEKEVINLRESMEKGIRVVKRKRTRERLEEEKGKMIYFN